MAAAGPCAPQPSSGICCSRAAGVATLRALGVPVQSRVETAGPGDSGGIAWVVVPVVVVSLVEVPVIVEV